MTHLKEVFTALRKHQLFCNPSKCVLAGTSVKFLSHIISGTSLKPDNDKPSAVRDWPAPRSVFDIRQFLGFANYFKWFIDHFSDISRPSEKATGRHFLGLLRKNQLLNVKGVPFNSASSPVGKFFEEPSGRD